MEVNFLSANQPIVKTYGKTPRGKLRKESYPPISRFTSFSYPINSLSDMEVAISEHAKAGNCLVKGVLQFALDGESRAGSTSPDIATQWICLDFDGVRAYENVDTALEHLGCGDTDYILQWSASEGMGQDADELRCHIFIFLHSKEHPATLKRWLKWLNLSTEIKEELRLTSTTNSLLWPLDITTCQNDKLLYIAPPVFEDKVKDPLHGKDRITLIKKKYRRLELDLSKVPDNDALAVMEQEIINAQRKQRHLPPRKNAAYKIDSNVEYLRNPDVAQITGQKTEREFTYFNFNGGDSWGYYHPINNPAFIYNFKGEPTYRTQDLLPTYWADIKARVERMEPDAAGSVYLAFRDFQSATYWNGIFNVGENKIIKLAQARSESQLRHFMKQHGQPMGDYIPDWEMRFDPHMPYVVDQKQKKLNTYRRSIYFDRKPELQDECPSMISKVIFHATGSEHGVYEHFMNWLAVIVQHRTMTGTAWVLHGAQGTGKGVMFNHIITPLFGDNNVTSRRMEELGSDFTEFMKNKFVVFIDEVQAGNTLYHERIAAKLKNLIVEPRISVREMYRPSEVMPNYTNLIFASNSPRPVSIAPDDRRYNVGTYQQNPIDITSEDIQLIASELGDFYDYMHTRSADTSIARKPLITADRQRIINSSRPAIEIAIEALKNGDMEFFTDMLMAKTELINPRMQLVHDQYKALVEELQVSRRIEIPRDDIMVLMRWCVDSVPESPNKFTSLMRHHGIDMKVIWVGGKHKEV